MKIILCGADMPRKYRKKLEYYADRTEVMPPCARIGDSTSTHPDMLGYAANGTLFLAQGYYAANRSFFDGLGCRIVTCDVGYGEYPQDVFFNVFEVGGALYGRTDVTPDAIKELYPRAVRVNQGYAKCSAVVAGSCVVTADAGIARAVSENGIDALLIRPGGVELKGYPHGFIGGSVVCPAPGTLVPIGDLDAHPDGEEIRRFAALHGLTVDPGDRGDALTDCGGILTLDTGTAR